MPPMRNALHWQYRFYNSLRSAMPTNHGIGIYENMAEMIEFPLSIIQNCFEADVSGRTSAGTQSNGCDGEKVAAMPKHV